MNRTGTILMLAAALVAAPAWAEPYQKAIDGLVQASYRYLAITHECRGLIGITSFQQARATAENSARATGMATDQVMLAVERMVTRLVSSPAADNQRGLHGCTTAVNRAKQDVLTWRTTLDKAQHSPNGL
jgi:hypothetical protein